jgi:hypothetical protein
MSETLVPLSWLIAAIGGGLSLIVPLLILLIKKTSEADKWLESVKYWEGNAKQWREAHDQVKSRLKAKYDQGSNA